MAKPVLNEHEAVYNLYLSYLELMFTFPHRHIHMVGDGVWPLLYWGECWWGECFKAAVWISHPPAVWAAAKTHGLHLLTSSLPVPSLLLPQLLASPILPAHLEPWPCLLSCPACAPSRLPSFRSLLIFPLQKRPCPCPHLHPLAVFNLSPPDMTLQTLSPPHLLPAPLTGV